jgi:hypothetical protein
MSCSVAISSSAYRHGDALISNILVESWRCSNHKHPCLSHGCVLTSNVLLESWQCHNLERPVRVLGQRSALAKFSLSKTCSIMR